jgi:hypothetical protein
MLRAMTTSNKPIEAPDGGLPTPDRERAMVPWDKRLGGTGEPPDEIRASARAMWEGVPNSSAAQIRAWKNQGGWVKTHLRMPGMSQRAHEAADRYTEQVAEAVGAEPGAKVRDADVPPALADSVARSVSDDLALDVRGQLLNRHRQEWGVPRKLAYEAVKSAGTPGFDPVAAFEKAKLAKITAETLTLVQGGERKAYGLKDGDLDTTAVLIDRGGDGGGE